MEKDIELKIQEQFLSRSDSVFSDIETAQQDYAFTDRIIRCILQLAKGDQSRIQDLIYLASSDERDLIWQAEYDCSEIRKRDLVRSFDDVTSYSVEFVPPQFGWMLINLSGPWDHTLSMLLT